MKQARTTKTTRTILAGLLAAGAAAFLAAAPAVAANPAGFVLRVTCGDTQPPAAVADLSAAADSSTDGRVILMWTAPADLPGNGAVSGYELRYATFTLASVGGSTTTWWNQAQPYAPSLSWPVQAPGGAESQLLDHLPSQAFTFAIRSKDAAGNWSALGFSNSATPKGTRPAPVAGLLALINPDTSFNVNWDPVTLNVAGSSTTVIDYAVSKSTSLAGPFNVVLSSGTGASGFTFNAAGAPSSLEYLMVSARDGNGNSSDPTLSNLLEVTPQGIIGQIALAQSSTGTLSHAYVPSTIMGELASKDLLMRMTPDADPNLTRDPRALSTYDVSFVSPAQVVDKNFTLSRPSMQVTMQYAAPSGASVGVMWWNGSAWIRVGEAVPQDLNGDGVNDAMSFYTGLPGTYQVRVFQAPTSLTLDKASVFPRIFTPNGDGINDRVLFAIENPQQSSIEAKIYDIGGNEVSDLKPAGAGAPTPDTLEWDGRDRDGRLVRAGAYIYRIKGEGKTMTGTVVVAK